MLRYINPSRIMCAEVRVVYSALFSSRTWLQYHVFSSMSRCFFIFLNTYFISFCRYYFCMMFSVLLLYLNSWQFCILHYKILWQGGFYYDNSDMPCHKMLLQWTKSLFQRWYWNHRRPGTSRRWNKLQQFSRPFYSRYYELWSAALWLW